MNIAECMPNFIAKHHAGYVKNFVEKKSYYDFAHSDLYALAQDGFIFKINIWGKISTNFEKDLCLAAYIRKTFAYPTILVDAEGNIMNYCRETMVVLGLGHLTELNNSKLNITFFIPHLLDFFFHINEISPTDLISSYRKKKLLFFTPTSEGEFKNFLLMGDLNSAEGKPAFFNLSSS